MKTTNTILRAGTMLATALVMTLGVAASAKAEDTTLTVWDWKSGDPTTAPYFEKVKTDFEAAHPGVTVKFVMQPHDQYYTLLGTAIAASRGPDVVLVHGGSQAKERIAAFSKLDAKSPTSRPALPAGTSSPARMAASMPCRSPSRASPSITTRNSTRRPASIRKRRPRPGLTSKRSAPS